MWKLIQFLISNLISKKAEIPVNTPGTVLSVPMFITRREVLMNRDLEFPLSPELEANLEKLLLALNRVRIAYGKPMAVSSGYRPGHFNIDAHGAPNSTHTVCQACDFADPDGLIDQFCQANQKLLESCGLWQENPANTIGWCHLDIRPREPRNTLYYRTFNP